MGPEPGAGGMTPTLVGRIQTRLFLVATFGLAWTIVVLPFLPRPGVTLGEVFGGAIAALILVALFGVGWEFLYHRLQQYRWEKDWPSFFGLVTGIPEGVLVYAFLPVPFSTFLVHFLTTWVVIWLAAHGPMRVLFPRWRFRGGRLL